MRERVAEDLAPIVPIELVAGVVELDPVGAEEEVEVLPDVLAEAMTFVAPLLEAIARGPAPDAPELSPPVTPARAARRLFSMAFAGRVDPDVGVGDELELKEATNLSTRLFRRDRDSTRRSMSWCSRQRSRPEPERVRGRPRWQSRSGRNPPGSSHKS